MSNSGIYCITNIATGMLYIGQAYNLVDRKNKHYYKLKNNNHTNKYMQSSYNKYGKDDFIFTVLEIADINSLNSREQYWIDLYKNIGYKLYNLRLEASSNRGYKHSEETKRKVGLSSLGRKHSKESVEARRAKDYIPVVQIDKHTNEVIKIWECATIAAKVLNINRPHISSVCNKKRNSTGGYKWEYYDEANK